MGEVYYLVMRLQKWENVGVEPVKRKLPFPVKMVKPENGEVGFVPVFDDIEKAKDYAGDKAEVIAITEV